MALKVMFLAGDYWHPAETVRPLAEHLFPDGVHFTADPADFMAEDYDLLVTCKEPSEDNRVPTPVWCDDAWTEKLIRRVREGMGLIVAHAGICDVKPDHPIVTELTHGTFITHPAQCPVSVRVTAKHPVTEGWKDFTLPENDEHYMVAMLPGHEGEIVAETVSEHGTQPGMWAHSYGKGRVCVFTPGHVTPNLLACADVYRSMAAWCAGA